VCSKKTYHEKKDAAESVYQLFVKDRDEKGIAGHMVGEGPAKYRLQVQFAVPATPQVADALVSAGIPFDALLTPKFRGLLEDYGYKLTTPSHLAENIPCLRDRVLQEIVTLLKGQIYCTQIV
jgi:hypothetical protein